MIQGTVDSPTPMIGMSRDSTKLTRMLLPVSEGEFIEYTPGEHRLFAVGDGHAIERAPKRSRLQAKDAALLPQFRTYMEQEIDAQEET